VTHEQFVAAFRRGTITVQVDRKAAARMMSGRLLLPFVLLPLLGLGVALALSGRLFTGIALFAAALGLRLLVHASSRGFVLNRSLQDAAFYDEMRRAGVLVVSAV
jgi:hypothetical protein